MATQTTLPRIGNGSLSEQATHALLQMILDRTFPNDRLPNEPDLADQMGLSRTTVRAALQSLERLGVISRVPGRGTQVRPQVDRSSLLLHRIIGIRGMLEAQYSEVSLKQKFYLRDTPSERAVAELGISAQERVLMNEKTYVADGQPAAYLLQEVPAAYVQPELLAQLVAEETEFPPTIFEFSRFWPNREIDNTMLELVPSIAGEKEQDLLGLTPGTACLELHETHYSARNEPVAIGTEIVNDKFVRFRLVRTR